MTDRIRLSTTRRLALFLAHGGICHICGGKIVGKLWEVEHVIPLKTGGADDESNMRPAHKVCHAGKTAVDLGNLAKSKRLEARRHGIRPRRSNPLPGSKASGLRKRMNGTVEKWT